ncbi:MAG: methionyl-tRNA formyltransferase [Solirubrobacterales bacterium]
MRTVYLGTSDFAATVLRRVAGSRHTPALVVTRPSRPKGRGQTTQDPPVAELARELGIELLQPESVNETGAVDRIRATGAEALVVCAFGAIIKEPLLSMMSNFNVHPSLLPRWRGAAPIERAIAAGDQQTGVTIIELVEQLDAGPICAQATLAIGPDDDYGSIAPRLAALGGELLVEALDTAVTGALHWTGQTEAGGQDRVTYAEKITRADRTLRPASVPAVELERMIRALTPQIGAMLETEGDPLRVERAVVTSKPVEPGVAVELDGRLLVGTPEDTLELLRVKPAGKQAMDVASYLRGNGAPALVG